MSESKSVMVVSLGPSAQDREFDVTFLDQTIHVERRGTDGSVEKAGQLLSENDGKVDAFGLDSMNMKFVIGHRVYHHEEITALARQAKKTPVVDGTGLKTTLERWAISDVARKIPGIFSNKMVFITSGIDRHHMATVLEASGARLVFGDPVIHFGLPFRLKSMRQLEWYARFALPRLCKRPYKALYPVGSRQEQTRPLRPTYWQRADIIAGGLHYIRRYGPDSLRNKVIVTNALMKEDLDDLRKRGVRTIITTTPEIDGESFGTNVLEAIFTALLDKGDEPITTDDYLNLISRTGIEPRILYPQGKPVEVEKFAFFIHPLAVSFIFSHPKFWWLRFFPQRLVEWAMAFSPPMLLSHVTGARSATGKELEGWLLGLGATPKEMMRRDPEFFYRRLVKGAYIAQKLGARIMGLGAFTSIVGDAGITVDQRSPIAVTSGNSYTVSSTLEAAKVALRKLGRGDRGGHAVVVGATGSIGNVISRLIARVTTKITLVAPRPEKLIELQKKIQTETECEVIVATRAEDVLRDADLIITTTTARGKKILDIMKVKPGCVICDVARPLDISEEDARKRPDVLVIESGELLVPGPVDFGIDIGLPPKTAYACLAETMILSMEGRYESYSLGRDLDLDKVKTIYKLGKKHGFQLAAIRSFGRVVTDQEFALIRERIAEAEQRLQMAEPEGGAREPGPGEAVSEAEEAREAEA